MLLKSPAYQLDQPVIRWMPEGPYPKDNPYIYAGEAYIDALIKGSGKKGKFHQAEIFVGDTLIAWGCFQELVLYREDLNELGRLFGSDSKLSLRLESLFKLLVNIRNGKKGLRILIAGNAQVSGPFGLFFRNSVDEKTQALIWTSVLESCENQFGPYSIILAKEFRENQKLTIGELKKLGLRKINSLPVMTMQLNPEWKSFKDYIAAMSSKYRIRAKAARKKGKAVRREDWQTDQINARLEEINTLYRNVFNKARFRLFRMEADYFSALKENLGESLHFNAYLQGDKLIGFSTSIFHEHQADAHLIGIDYEANKEFSLYQNMLYDYVEKGISSGITKIDFGRTAMEIKSTVGAIPEDMHVMVKIRNTILDGLTCILMENSSPRDWVQRHPFRDESIADIE
ncbi:MAG: GNAT family N-acetyltransferase [Bacteroidia bacterium]